MEDRTILVLGGYGGAGRAICEWLLKETVVGVVVAGRRLNRAEELSASLNKEFPGNRISAVFADASDQQSLQQSHGSAE